ncbi:MAG: LacI family transcriptional regulator [Chryseobacterium sp.]|nr:MAG: LacI family transcriptional regulator [Chryseobacterium sp.]
MKEKELTIYDLANHLGISAATVSRALQDHPAVSQKTKKKIMDLAAKMGYRSNKFASNLRKQRSNTIGVIVPRLNSLFISSVLSGMERILNDANYNLIIGQSLEQEAREKVNAITMFNSRVDALVVSLAADTQDMSHFARFTKRKIPILFFDRTTDAVPATRIMIDNFSAGYKATTHLIEQGCKKIVHLTGNLLRDVYKDRFDGYKAALDDNGLLYNPELLISNDMSEFSVREAFVNYIRKSDTMPDGLFAANDTSAAFVLTVLKENGLSAPDDIAIVGFNNDLTSRITDPQITTINYPGIEMGQNIARILLSQIEGDGLEHYTNTVILSSDLLIRPSSMRKVGI